MPTWFNRIHKYELDLNVIEKGSVSSLLIPDELASQLTRILPLLFDKHGVVRADLRLGLQRLLRKYRGFFAGGHLPFQSKPKLLYQDEGLNLRRFSFRPNPADWFELGILAYGLGVSRCWLFSYLLKLELGSIGEMLELKRIRDVLATPNASRPRLIWQLRGKRRFLNRILHFRL